MNNTEILNKIYYDVEKGLGTAQQLYEQVKDKGIKLNEVKNFINNQETQQIFAPKHKNYTAIIGHTNEDYQMDSMYLEQYKKQNDGYIGLMNFIEITSRKAYCIPIKNKTQSEISRVFEIFYKQVNGKIKTITTDNEASFKNAILKHKNITHYTCDPNEKTMVGKIERFNRTIRTKITKYMKTFKTAKWIDVIDKLVSNYNNTKHSVTKMRPIDVISDEKFNKIRDIEQKKSENALDEISMFNIGDKVRVLKNKSKFAKGGEEFSKGIYIIDKINNNSFILKNSNGDILKRNYKNWQIKLVGDHIGKAPENQNIEKHSFKKIKKHNKFIRKQNKEFGEGKNYEVKEITDEGKVIYKDRLIPKNEKRIIKSKNENEYEVDSIVDDKI